MGCEQVGLVGGDGGEGRERGALGRERENAVWGMCTGRTGVGVHACVSVMLMHAAYGCNLRFFHEEGGKAGNRGLFDMHTMHKLSMPWTGAHTAAVKLHLRNFLLTLRRTQP